MDAAAEDAPRSGAPRRGWQRRVRRTRALGPAYFSVAVRWAAWGWPWPSSSSRGPPRYDLRLTVPYLVLTFVQTALFAAYYPFFHRRLRRWTRRAPRPSAPRSSAGDAAPSLDGLPRRRPGPAGARRRARTTPLARRPRALGGARSHALPRRRAEYGRPAQSLPGFRTDGGHVPGARLRLERRRAGRDRLRRVAAPRRGRQWHGAGRCARGATA